MMYYALCFILGILSAAFRVEVLGINPPMWTTEWHVVVLIQTGLMVALVYLIKYLIDWLAVRFRRR